MPNKGTEGAEHDTAFQKLRPLQPCHSLSTECSFNIIFYSWSFTLPFPMVSRKTFLYIVPFCSFVTPVTNSSTPRWSRVLWTFTSDGRWSWALCIGTWKNITMRVPQKPYKQCGISKYPPIHRIALWSWKEPVAQANQSDSGSLCPSTDNTGM